MKVGKIIELYYSTNSGRVNTRELVLDNRGVIEDKYYNKNIQRSVLIASHVSYTKVAKEGIDIPYGSLGENLLIDINPYDLNIGTKISIGDVVLEITKSCTLCKGLGKVDSRLPELLKCDRGIFAKVINAGLIKINQKLVIHEYTQNTN